MKNLYIVLLVATLTFTGCQPSKTVIQTAIAQTQASIPTKTLIPATNTSIPATNTPQPTNTQVPTQIPLESFGELNFVESLRNNPAANYGILIKAITYHDGFYGKATDYSLMSADINSPRGIGVLLDVNQVSDETSQQLLKGNEWFWIYGKIIEPEGNAPKIVVYFVEAIPKPIQPKSSGVFKVGVDIAPGTWKSMSDATITQECYWARSDKNGNIIENFFGYGGTTIYIAETDYAFENNACGSLLYLGKDKKP